MKLTEDSPIPGLVQQNSQTPLVITVVYMVCYSLRLYCSLGNLCCGCLGSGCACPLIAIPSPDRTLGSAGLVGFYPPLIGRSKRPDRGNHLRLRGFPIRNGPLLKRSPPDNQPPPVSGVTVGQWGHCCWPVLSNHLHLSTGSVIVDRRSQPSWL